MDGELLKWPRGLPHTMMSIYPKLSNRLAAPVLVILAVVSHMDTARAQNTLLFSPPTVNFSTNINPTPAPQNVNVSLNNQPVTSLTYTSTTYAAGQTVGWIATVV